MTTTQTAAATITVPQAGEPAALAGVDAVLWISSAILAMPEEHPSRVRVMLKCLVAGNVLQTDGADAWDDQEAEQLVDALLADPALLEDLDD